MQPGKLNFGMQPATSMQPINPNQLAVIPVKFTFKYVLRPSGKDRSLLNKRFRKSHIQAILAPDEWCSIWLNKLPKWCSIWLHKLPNVRQNLYGRMQSYSLGNFWPQAKFKTLGHQGYGIMILQAEICKTSARMSFKMDRVWQYCAIRISCI